MRYADGGGLTEAGRLRREAVRMQAAGLFEQEARPSEVARRLRVSPKSSYLWHQFWREGGASMSFVKFVLPVLRVFILVMRRG
ncbi:helix-turn-helix domain-containing protein [Streptomyces sp. NPDC056358]|uniref:helix-turn-helix domain-containing protein n=1 Tax=Streptomyces sp. NPDC056358 TaxID=3345794 RepID=UPI0035D87D6B